MASEEASRTGGQPFGAAPVVAAVNLDDTTLAAIITGVVGKIQEAQRESGGGGEIRGVV